MLILENGAYGKRQVKICKVLGIDYHHATFPEDSIITGKNVQDILQREGPFAMVSVVHCETSSGVFNDVEPIGKVINKESAGWWYMSVHLLCPSEDCS